MQILVWYFCFHGDALDAVSKLPLVHDLALLVGHVLLKGGLYALEQRIVYRLGREALQGHAEDPVLTVLIFDGRVQHLLEMGFAYQPGATHLYLLMTSFKAFILLILTASRPLPCTAASWSLSNSICIVATRWAAT